MTAGTRSLEINHNYVTAQLRATISYLGDTACVNVLYLDFVPSYTIKDINLIYGQEIRNCSAKVGKDRVLMSSGLVVLLGYWIEIWDLIYELVALHNAFHLCRFVSRGRLFVTMR